MEKDNLTAEPTEAEIIEPGKGFTRRKIIGATGSRQFARDWGDGIAISSGPPKQKRRPGRGGASELEISPKKNTPDTPELQALAGKIKAEFEAVSRCSMKAAEHMVELGQLLDQARTSIPRGGWLKWIEAECGIKKSSVYNYLAITSAVQRGEIDLPTVGSLGLKAALKMIAKPKVEAIADRSTVEVAPSPPVATDCRAQEVPPAEPVRHINVDTYCLRLVDEIEAIIGDGLGGHRNGIAQHKIADLKRLLTAPRVAPPTKITAAAFDHLYGPLTGEEWLWLAQKNAPNRYTSLVTDADPDFLKLAAQFNVPLQALDDWEG